MVTRMLFGVRNSPHRMACVALAWVVAGLGVAVAVVQGWSTGVPVVAVGLLAVAVLARHTAAAHEKSETRAQLDRLKPGCDDEALRQMVQHSPHDPNRELAKVTSAIDAAEIRNTVARFRAA